MKPARTANFKTHTTDGREEPLEFSDSILSIISIPLAKDNLVKNRGFGFFQAKEQGAAKQYLDHFISVISNEKYNVKVIPRFILIDPQGRIVDANAIRMSNPEFLEEFESLNL
ncbi:MAG: hypothetical protein AAFU57_11585 [Bacteroidota bacterium]